mmetsp:Transcript_87357/g.187323  ORF Transcript_87357/g.187323 Transcript_87357/m.187323 type:complete len:438 (-) Transcript_87357:135-1448(-)
MAEVEPAETKEGGAAGATSAAGAVVPATTASSAAAANRRRWADISLNEIELEEDEELEALRQGEGRPAWADFPCSPVGLALGFSPANIEVPRIGVDIGGVITRARPGADTDLLVDWGKDHEAPGAFAGLRRLVEIFGRQNVWLVSKVKPGGLMQRKTEHWLHETCRFCDSTGIPRSNVVFCGSINGPSGKGVVAERLGLSHFVDDNFECLLSVFGDRAGNAGHLVEKHRGLLLHFGRNGEGGTSMPSAVCEFGEVPPRMRRFYRAVTDWASLLRAFDSAGLRKQSGSVGAAMTPPPSRGRDAAAVAAATPASVVAGGTTSSRNKKRGSRGGARNREKASAGHPTSQQVVPPAQAQKSPALGAPAVTAVAAPESRPPPKPPAVPATVLRAPVAAATAAAPSPPAPSRPRLQLKPRSENLGAVGGKAEVTERTSRIFGV